MIAISTTWNYSENCDLEKMLSEISALGIKSIELGYNFTRDRLSEITPLLKAKDIDVVSVHNFCPLPTQNLFHRFFTNYYFLSALSKTERECAVKYTKQSIDTAANLNAKIVIIHAGAIEMDNKYVKELLGLFSQGKIETGEAAALRDNILKSREDKKQPYLDSVTQSLNEITEYAFKKNVKIGLENRYYPNEIPNNEETGVFLKKFNDKGLVYWHDTGHARAQEHLGITEKDSLLKSYGSYLFGFHLHGIKGLHDHLSPMSGDFESEQVCSHLNNRNLLKVIESHQPATSNELTETIRYFAKREWC
ncbi:MAG: TIM barrel protein [Candidatus Omnitrophica bacterium]|nr:TIM barrel protein [Candidatus Omnitrophota bacterium]